MKKETKLTDKQQEYFNLNSKLVHYVIHNLSSKFKFIPYDILYDGGIDGLIFAIKHYIESKGTFATYARKCIYCRILSAVNTFVTKDCNKVDINDLSIIDNTDYEDNVLKKEYNKKIFDIIYNILNEKEKMFVFLRYEQDYSLNEIAEVMGKSLFTINLLKNKVHKLIKDKLKEEIYTL